MISLNLKSKAVQLRKKGYSYPQIENLLQVSRSTLSGWCKDIELSPHAQKIILKRRQNSLIRVREKALKVLTNKRALEQKEVLSLVESSLQTITWNKIQKEIVLAALYLGEGFKKKSVIGLGNSNPQIVKAFVNLLRDIYPIGEDKFRCILYLRVDQSEQVEKLFWSNTLNIPREQFRKTQFDKRTFGKKTWIGYHGVCAVYYYDAKVEKRITAMQELLFNYI